MIGLAIALAVALSTAPDTIAAIQIQGNTVTSDDEVVACGDQFRDFGAGGLGGRTRFASGVLNDFVVVAGGQVGPVVTHFGLASVAPVVSCQICTCGVASKPFCSPFTKRSKKRTSCPVIGVELTHIEW